MRETVPGAVRLLASSLAPASRRPLMSPRGLHSATDLNTGGHGTSAAWLFLGSAARFTPDWGGVPRGAG